MYVLRIRIVILHGHLDRNTVLLGVDIDDRLNDRRAARSIEILDELLEALLRIEMLARVVALIVRRTHVGQREVYTLVQEGQLTQTVCQNVVFVFGRMREDRAVGLERDSSTAVVALTNNLKFRHGGSLAVTLLVYLASAVNLCYKLGREGVDARYTHTVQTSRDLVAALVELTSRVQNSEHHLECRLALLLVEVDRNASTVILDRDRVVRIDGDLDM